MGLYRRDCQPRRFLFAYSYGDALHRAYLLQCSTPVVTSPYEHAALQFAVGAAITLAAILLYGVGGRNRSVAAGGNVTGRFRPSGFGE